MATSHDLLRLDNIKKTFINADESKTVLQSINLSLSKSDSFSVVGPSGCGKTTLLLITAGLLPPTEGSVWMDGSPINSPNRKIALVLQHYGLLPWKTVAANIMLGAHLQKIKIIDEELVAVKQELGIEDIDHLYPGQLSGGQRQRVALARAILLRPSLLLLDEPFAAIDTITRERLQNRLLTIFTERKFSFVIVTHNIEEAVFLGRKIMVLDNQGAGIRTVIENPEMGSLEYRNKPAFFELCLELRTILEKIS
jgi:NitT/TauT family transport system ATP-binding protein